MWTLDNDTALAADRTWVRDKDGRHHWIVAIKATFQIRGDGELALADEQLPLLHEPEYFGPPESSSLRYDADLIGPKPGTDLILNASAHAPGGRPAREVIVELRVGQLAKALLVRGDSRYVYGIAGLRVTEPEPFVTRPIRYESAHGGSDLASDDPRHQEIDLRNPVGLGVARSSDRLHGRPAASIYYPRGDPAKLGPAGFGAIASHWSPRRELAGTYDQAWSRRKRPLLPDDFDPQHFLCSPADQRPQPRFTGGEVIVLVNMTPEGVLRLQLPRMSFVAQTRIARQRIEHGFELATVVIEPDQRRLIMVWQSCLPVPAPQVDDLRNTRVGEVRT